MGILPNIWFVASYMVKSAVLLCMTFQHVWAVPFIWYDSTVTMSKAPGIPLPHVHSEYTIPLHLGDQLAITMS